MLEEDSDDGERGVAHGAEDVAAAGEVMSERRTSDIYLGRGWQTHEGDHDHGLSDG